MHNKKYIKETPDCKCSKCVEEMVYVSDPSYANVDDSNSRSKSRQHPKSCKCFKCNTMIHNKNCTCHKCNPEHSYGCKCSKCHDYSNRNEIPPIIKPPKITDHHQNEGYCINPDCTIADCESDCLKIPIKTKYRHSERCVDILNNIVACTLNVKEHAKINELCVCEKAKLKDLCVSCDTEVEDICVNGTIHAKSIECKESDVPFTICCDLDVNGDICGDKIHARSEFSGTRDVVAGQAIVAMDEPTTIVKSPIVSEDSLVFLTPLCNNELVWVTNVNGTNQEFTINREDSTSELKVNWLVINTCDNK